MTALRPSSGREVWAARPVVSITMPHAAAVRDDDGETRRLDDDRGVGRGRTRRDVVGDAGEADLLVDRGEQHHARAQLVAGHEQLERVQHCREPALDVTGAAPVHAPVLEAAAPGVEPATATVSR